MLTSVTVTIVVLSSVYWERMFPRSLCSMRAVRCREMEGGISFEFLRDVGADTRNITNLIWLWET